VIETWVAEEELDLWEIRAFSERSEGQACHAYIKKYVKLESPILFRMVI